MYISLDVQIDFSVAASAMSIICNYMADNLVDGTAEADQADEDMIQQISKIKNSVGDRPDAHSTRNCFGFRFHFC